MREVTEHLYDVPLGTSREQMIKTLITTFGEKLPEYLRDYNQFSPPSPVTQSMIKADTELIAICKKDHKYLRVYPSDLYQKMPPGALTEPIGFVAEVSDGNGFVSVFYDSHTNYIGFIGSTSGPER